VVGPAGSPSIAERDRAVLWWCMQDRAVERRGLAGAPPCGPSDLIDALAVDLFTALMNPRTVCGCQLVILEHRQHLGV
jgi:hypothetical protein